MKVITKREEIAKAINSHQAPVVRLDIANTDDYGIKSQKVLIDNGTFKDGFPYYIKAEIRAYTDEREFTFSGFCTCLSADFGYSDMEEMLELRNAPIIQKDSDVILSIVNSKTREACYPIILHTSDRIDAHCSTPLTFIKGDRNADMYLMLAGK